MTGYKDITAQRWFMGKNRKVLSADTVDCLSLGGVTLSIEVVQFQSSEQDYYLLVENEECAGAFSGKPP